MNFQADSAFTREEFAQKLREGPVDVVVSDYRMKGWTAMDALAMIQESWPEVPLILVSGTLGDELAVECMKRGVTDYLLKGQLARPPMAYRHAQKVEHCAKRNCGRSKLCERARSITAHSWKTRQAIVLSILTGKSSWIPTTALYCFLG